MLITQTSIEARSHPKHPARLLTFQLQELPEKASNGWREFRVLRLDYNTEIKGRKTRWRLAWNGERFAHRRKLRERFPQILAWAEQEIRAWYP